MRLIDADKLTRPEILSKYYHLPNGDIAIPIIDIKHAPTVDAVPLDELCKILADNNDCPPGHNPVQDYCFGKSCAECWKSVLMEWMEDDCNS